MKNHTFNYVRVSTLLQNTDRQLDGIDCDRVYEDKASGKDTDRPQLTAMMMNLREGDTVNVHSIDRLARNLDNLRSLVTEMTAKGATVKFHKEGLTFTGDTTSPMNELLLNMLGAVAQFERSIINERRLEGIAQAQAKGTQFGRKADTDRTTRILELLDTGMSVRAVASELKCGVSTVQRAKKQS